MPEIKIIKVRNADNRHPIVDIILPVYKHPELTQKCLDSIAEHTVNYNVIIVDNSEDNVGVVKAENLGIQESKNDYVLIVGNDTTFSSNWLENMLYRFQLSKHNHSCFLGFPS